MSIIEHIVSIFAPHTCLGCGVEEDKLLCQGCADGLVPVPSRCYRCRGVTDEYRVCDACAVATPLRQAVVCTQYSGLAKQLVHRLKYERAQSASGEIAQLMAALADCLSDGVLLVPIPTATSRVRARGYDHAALLARQLSRYTGLPQKRLLARVGQARQVGARRNERLRQLETAFRSLRPSDIRGQHIVLVDDVLTTGATLETAARLLLREGASRVDAIVFAQA